jgi:hypothetical protein
MKPLRFILILLATASLSWGDDVPQGAVDYFANKYGHDHPDTLQIVPVSFRGNGPHQFLMTFAKDDWTGPDAVWGVVEFTNGQWGEPKTIDIDGQTKDFSAINFDPTDASFVYLPSYKRYGLLAHWRRDWTFTYFTNDAVYTYYFWTASQVGLTEDALKKLMDAHKVTVVQRTVP